MEEIRAGMSAAEDSRRQSYVKYPLADSRNSSIKSEICKDIEHDSRKTDWRRYHRCCIAGLEQPER